MTQASCLFIVYNADSGVAAILLDVVKKLVGIEDCALCFISHGPTGQKRDWKQCSRALNLPIVYVHRDELHKYPKLKTVLGGKLPAAAVETDDGVTVLLGPDELKQCGGDVPNFRSRLLDKAEALGIGLLQSD